MKRLPAVLVFLLLFLSCFAGTASAFMGDTLQNRVGDFFAPPCDCNGWNDPQSQYRCPENERYVYEVATGVVFYVVQNPWTKFDPLGLNARAAGVARGFGMSGSSVYMPEANRLAQQNGTSMAAQQYRMSGSHVIDRTSKDMAKGYVAAIGVTSTLGPGPEDAVIAGLAKTKAGQAVQKGMQNVIGRLSKMADEALQGSIEQTAKQTKEATEEAVEQTVNLTDAQLSKLNKFNKKNPKGTPDAEVDQLGDQALFTAETPGKVPGSKKVYQKSVDADGTTTSYTKTTVTPDGRMDKVTDSLEVPEKIVYEEKP